jgi:hypothetical protein
MISPKKFIIKQNVWQNKLFSLKNSFILATQSGQKIYFSIGMSKRGGAPRSSNNLSVSAAHPWERMSQTMDSSWVLM